MRVWRLGFGRTERQAQPLNSLVAGDLSQVFQKGQRQWGSEILPSQILTGKKAEEVKQIVSISRERIRRVTTSRQMTQETCDDLDRLLVITEEFKRGSMIRTTLQTSDLHNVLPPEIRLGLVRRLVFLSESVHITIKPCVSV